MTTMATSEAKKAYLREYYQRNRSKTREQQAAYVEANRGSVYAQQRGYYERNKDACRALMTGFAEANPTYRRDYNASYYAENRAGFIERARRRVTHTTEKATPAWADREAIDALYAEAARLTAETGVPHEVDHVVPLKHPRVCGLHVHFNLQVLTRAANRAKRNKFDL